MSLTHALLNGQTTLTDVPALVGSAECCCFFFSGWFFGGGPCYSYLSGSGVKYCPEVNLPYENPPSPLRCVILPILYLYHGP